MAAHGPQVYYFNTLTNESSWTKPAGFVGDAQRASAQPTPVATERVRGTTWSQVTCDDGKKYYYNMRTMARPRREHGVLHPIRI